MKRLKASHTLAEEVGWMATEAGVKTLVLNHFVRDDTSGMTEQEGAVAVRPTFDGPIVVGHDRLRIEM